jgi:hypothetical protein
MFNLGYKTNSRVLHLQMDLQKGCYETDRHLHNSFFSGGEGLPNLWVSSLSSIWFFFCVVVHKLKQVKNDISLLAWIKDACFYWEFMFELVLVLKLTLIAEPEWTTNMQVDLKMLVGHQDWAQNNFGLIILGDYDSKRQLQNN